MIDNACGHPVNVENYASNVKLFPCLPIQSMDQGVVATFEAYLQSVTYALFWNLTAKASKQ
jgi:hypothetical protein